MGGRVAFRGMPNVLNNEKKQQILALGQLGWSLRRIQQATRVRRETISSYLKSAGVGVWPPGGWGRQAGSKPAIGVTTDSGVELSAPRPQIQGVLLGESAKPAMRVTTGFGVELRGPRSGNPGRSPSMSACEPFQEAIDLGLSRGRNAMAYGKKTGTSLSSIRSRPLRGATVPRGSC